MKIKSSLRNKLILAVFTGCLIPYLLGGFYLKTYIEKGLYNNNISYSDQILKQVSELIDKSLISEMQEELDLLTSLDIVKNADTGINHYLNYDPITFEYQKYPIEQEIESYFKAIGESHETVNFIFLGTESGGYLEYPRFSPQKSYDPRVRPWYTNTINQEDAIVSEPYLTKMTNEMVISFTKRITKGDQVVGVVGISVNLEELTDSISQINLGDSGYVMVMSPEHRLIVSPGHPEWILKSPSEINKECFKIIATEQVDDFEAELDGAVKVFHVLTEENGLHIITVIDKKEILKEAHAITKILISIYSITFILIFFIVYYVAKRITRPILDISSVINRMTEFDFGNSALIKKYAKRPDEIGIVSSALVHMNDNYLEFTEQVNSLDNDIKHIDIKSDQRYKLELSCNNPFEGVVHSINGLLDKNYMYFDQLKEKNEEILENNELLTATEEELKAQLEEINMQKEYINFLANHDPLTEMPNRRNFIEYLLKKIEQGGRGAVVLVDLDDFKAINDIRGHVFGDMVLVTIAERFKEISGNNMFISRFGGDEFLFLIEYETDKKELMNYLDLISNLFDDKIQIDNIDIEIRYSMGLALFPDDSADVNQLIMDADLAMYSVKNSGKNGYQFFDAGMMEHQLKISNIENILKDAIRNDGFKLVYQPQVNIRTGEITGYEALVRLKDYNIPPVDFINVAENNGLIISIGRIVTQKVIEQLHEWKKAGLNIKPVSINYSANQLHDFGYIEFMQELLYLHGINTEFVEIEITENIFLDNQQVTLNFLKQLKQMGIKIAIDDFGTGYSSLNYLTFLPVDIIKLDRSLNIKFLEIKNVKVMDSLISLVHSLGLTVIAEGIETRDQVKTLKRAECDQIQGYYFSKPLEADEIPVIHNTVYHNY